MHSVTRANHCRFLTGRFARSLNASRRWLNTNCFAPIVICLAAATMATVLSSTSAAADVWGAFVGPNQFVTGSNACLLAQQNFVDFQNPLNPDPSIFAYFDGCVGQGGSGPGTTYNVVYSCHAPNVDTPNCPGGVTSTLWVNYGTASWISCDPGYIYVQGEGCVNASPADPNCSFCVGDPINPATGLPLQHYVDYQTAGPFPLKFERYYANNDQPRLSAGAITQTMFESVTGAWRSNFDAKMYSPYGSKTLYFALPDGRMLCFVDSTGSGNYVPGFNYVNVVNQGVSVAGGLGVGQTALLSSDGSLVTLTDRDGTHYDFERSGPARFGSLLAIRYAGGYSQTLNYDASTALLDTVTDSLGRSIGFQYDGNGHLTALTAGGSVVATYTYIPNPKQAATYSNLYPNGVPPLAAQASGALGSVTLTATNETTTYSYINDPNNPDYMILSGYTDPRGVTYSTWAFDSSSRVTLNTLAGNVGQTSLSYSPATLTFTPAAGYGTQTISTTITNPLGATEVATYAIVTPSFFGGGPFGFGANLLLTERQRQATSSLPVSTTTFSYDSNQFLSQKTDAEGRVTAFVNDPSTGLPTSITKGAGSSNASTTTYTWNTAWRVPTQIVEPGLTKSFSWSNSGQLTSYTLTDTTTTTVPYSTAGQTRTVTYAYGSNGLLSSVSGPLASQTVSYAYNSTGFIQSITDEVGHVTTVAAWNSMGQPTSITDPNGVITALNYDGGGRLTSLTVDPSGLSATTTMTYDGVGDITQITRPNGSYLRYTYDGARRVTKVQDNSGAYISYTRDNMGNLTAWQITDSSGNLQLSQTAVFDGLGRLLVHAYDKTDNRISVADPRSNVFSWSFDALNRLVSTKDEEASVVTLTRNGKDEITNYSDPRSLSTSFVRDGFGDVIQRISPDSGTTIDTYNALGKPTQITDGRGVVTNLTYDSAGRLLTKQYPAATSENITYTWDSTTGGNTGVGRVTSIQDASGSIAQIYNSLGQVIQETKTTGSATYTVGYGYDLDGNVTQITYPSGRVINYYRGTNGLVTTVTEQQNASAAANLLAKWVTYQPFGPLQSLVYGSGLVLWKTFTQDYSLNTLVVAEGSSTVINRGYSYWYGDFDITNIWDNVVTSRNENYVYTPNHWLQNDYGSWGETTYWQDGVGNRTAYLYNNNTTTTTTTLLYPYNSNQNVGETQGSTTIRTLGFDGAGNIITDTRGPTTYNYEYNNRGRLSQLTIGSTLTASYTYDGLERMAVRTTQNMTPSGTTHYVYDRAGRLLMEASSTGAVQTEYVWLDDTPLALFENLDTSSPQMYYMHPDHLDRPTKMTDVNQNVVWDAYYWPWGDVRSITGTATNNLRFPGQYFLVESGLHYNWHRHYDPTTGRYIQADPLGFVDGPSVYAYASSMPPMKFDPNGQQTTTMPGPWIPIPPIFIPGTPENKAWSDQISRGIMNAYNTCFPNKSCPPCKLADGTIVPIGTIGYRWDKLPSTTIQHGIAGDHLNIYEANQNPNNCQCFWAGKGAVPPPPEPGWIPIQPFAN
jgi:RHS repeat-associated protein